MKVGEQTIPSYLYDVLDERRLVAHLVARHAAAGVILVGSRADGVGRPGSDWDVYALRASGPANAVVPAPERFEGELLDVGMVALPVADEAVLAIFGPNLQQARVLLDTADGAAARIVAVARAAYARGRGLSVREKRLRRHELARNVSRMRARIAEPGAFFEAASFVFYVAHRAWFEVRHDRWSQSVHRALPEIRARDPEFHRWLEQLWGCGEPASRLVAAEAILAHLFGETELEED